ncbi:zonular occludens toxin domain-containing protein [Phormidium nigroviride]
MPFTAIYGLPGRGKSLFMLQYGLRLANQYEMRLVTNFYLEPLSLAYYCKVHNLTWLWNNLSKGVVYYVSASKNFTQFLQIKNAIILLDEMGLYAPAAQHWTLPPEAYNAIANNRKCNQHIIFAAQYPHQVHNSVNEICTDVIYCEGKAIWDKKLRNDKLIFKDAHAFDPPQFQIWFRDPKLRKNPIKVMVLAKKHWKGVLSCSDHLTFKCYDSFALIERESQSRSYAKLTYEYKPYLVEDFLEHSLAELPSNITFAEIEAMTTNLASQNDKKRKRISDAYDSLPFIAWKIEGQIPFPGPHPLTGRFTFLWGFPAVLYEKIKFLDLRVTREFSNWQRLGKDEKVMFLDSLKFMRNFVIGTFSVFFLISIFT